MPLASYLEAEAEEEEGEAEAEAEVTAEAEPTAAATAAIGRSARKPDKAARVAAAAAAAVMAAAGGGAKQAGLRVPAHVLERYCAAMDVVGPHARRSCCFTKNYTRYFKGAGSVLLPLLPSGAALIRTRTLTLIPTLTPTLTLNLTLTPTLTLTLTRCGGRRAEDACEADPAAAALLLAARDREPPRLPRRLRVPRHHLAQEALRAPGQLALRAGARPADRLPLCAARACARARATERHIGRQWRGRRCIEVTSRGLCVYYIYSYAKRLGVSSSFGGRPHCTRPSTAPSIPERRAPAVTVGASPEPFRSDAAHEDSRNLPRASEIAF